MRSVLLALLLMSAALVVAAQSRPQTKPRPGASPRGQQQFQQDQKAIAELQQQDIAANIAFDTEKLLTLCTDDVVLLPPDQPPIRGKDALRAYYEQARKQLGNTDILGYDENWDEVQMSGDIAVQWGTITERTRPATSDKEATTTVRAMRVLKRQEDGSWLIARAIWNNVPPAPAQTPPK
jgi:uncharacterized protein (TIGR02246 family)